MRLSRIYIPYYLLLLPVFFVLHRFSENYGYISPGSAMGQAAIFLVAAVVLTGLFFIFYKNMARAGLMAAYLLAFNFFFGNVFDLLEQQFPGSIFTRYSFLVPLFLVLGVILFLLVRKRNWVYRVTFYLNVLFIILLIIEIGTLIIKSVKNKGTINLVQADPKYVSCTNCPKPDVYIIVMDEYAGSDQLNRVFNFDNSGFEDSLRSRKFRFLQSTFSNYNFTPYSIASLLNRRHLDTSATGFDGKKGYPQALHSIDNNSFFPFFITQGYQFFNYSYFKVSGKVAPTRGDFIPANKPLLNEPTFLSRFKKDILANLARRYNLTSILKHTLMENKRNNDALYALTQKVSENRSGIPSAVFTHFSMPHYPYYFDKNGNPYPIEKLKDISIHNKDAYLGYLEYSNGKIISLIDHILSHSANPPVIVLLSDHGFRHANSSDFPEHIFSNLVAVHLPNQAYTAFRDTMTNVNVLTVVLNTAFGQQLPLTSDEKHVIKF